MGSIAATRFAHYRVLTRADGSLWTLGSGAMGITYRAVDERLDVEVALKVIATSKARQPGVEERFLREARAAARVRHPHVASVLFLHDTPGELFFAMEFIEGVSLAEWLRERTPVPPGLVIEFGQQLAQGLGAIHAQGIVHRDLKPANIMVLRDGERSDSETGAWRLKIIDFGVARTPLLLDQAATASGIFCGTAAYASPEQAGHGEGVDGRADLYALGCILWEMLTGHPPFRAEGLRALLQAHAVVPPPYDEIAHQPPSLTAILLRLLAKDPRERPADAAEVQRALERAKVRLTEEGGSRESTGLTQAFFRLAPGPDSSTTAPLRPPGARAWQIALGVGGVCLAAVAGFIAWQKSTGPAADSAAQRIVAVLPFEQIDSTPEEAGFAVGLQEDVLSQLSQVTELRVISRTSVLAFRNSPRTVRDIATNLGAGSVVEGSVRRFRERVRIKAQLVDARADRVLWSEAFERPWTDSFALQSELSASIARAVQVRLAPGRAGLLPERRTADAGAYEIYRRGLEAFRRLRVADNEEAIELFQKAIAKDAQFALAHAALADAYVMKVDRFEAPIYWLDAAIQAAEKSVAIDPRCAEGQGALGAACAARGWFGRARRAFQKAVELKPSFAEPTIRLANLLFFTGQWEEAWTLARRGVEIEPHAPSAFLSLAILHFGVGSEDAGERWLRRAMARLDDPLKRQHLEILLAFSRRDYAAVNRLMDERARSGVNDAQLYFSEIPGVVPPGYLHFMANWRLGKLAVCRSHLDAALRVADPDGFNYRQILVSEVVLLRSEGRTDEMTATARKLIALTERNEGAGSDAPEPRINKAVAYWLLGDRPRAEASIAAALRSELFLGRVDQDDTIVDALADCPGFSAALAEMNARLAGLRARLTQLDLEHPFQGP